MWHLAAGAGSASGDASALTIAIVGLLSVVVTAAAGVVVALLNTKRDRSRTHETETEHEGWVNARERIAILERRADDSDERDEVQDRRLDQTERYLDLDNPNWRHPSHDG